TVQCGNDRQCEKVWREIGQKSEGEFVAIPQDGGVAKAIPTEFDKRLAEINTELARSTLTYGDRSRQLADDGENKAGADLPVAAAAERAAFNAKNSQAASYDLLDNIKKGKVRLEEIKKEELPPELQKLAPAEQKEYLEKLDKRRGELQKEAVDLDKKRA